jgi:2-C-methyl-D-erythritol 2,4-cyclodiphosphate synthase
METRTGFGYDIHAFSSNPRRQLVLGGVEFPGEPGLEGHSDADVLLHAIVDALLGAAGLGDIGQIYPNDDPTWKNCSSMVFLTEASGKVKNAGWEIQNIDSTVLAEKPKIMSVSGEMRSRIASALSLNTDQVSIKATTNESLGAIGRGEGIAAFATAHIRRRIGGTTHGSPCT